jgi:hypothetical protein
MPRTIADVKPSVCPINAAPEGFQVSAGHRNPDWPEFAPWLSLILRAEAKFAWIHEHSHELPDYKAAEPHEQEASGLVSAANELAYAMLQRAVETERHEAMLVAIAVAAATRDENAMFDASSLSDARPGACDLGRYTAARLLQLQVRRIIDCGILPDVPFVL